MPIPVIAGAALAGKALLGIAGRAIAGQAIKAVAGQAAKTTARQAAKTTAQQAARHGVGRTASGRVLQAAKPRKQWDWKNMASNFASTDGDFV